MKKIEPQMFAMAVLGLTLYPWQAFALYDLGAKNKVTLRANNGSGKTAHLVAPAALWNAVCNPGSTTVITSATHTQLVEQIFAALQGYQTKLDTTGWKWNRTEIETAQGSRIIGRATNQGGRFEGFHSYPDRPLMVIVDEAKTVQEDIFIAVDRCDPTYLLYVSSPGGKLGRFHDSFASDRFVHHAISARDCPHIPKKYIDEMKAQYGENSEIYRSMILGEFSDDLDDGSVIPFGAYENCLRNPPLEQVNGDVVAFCDFAESSDENVLAIRRGNKVGIIDAWVQSNGSRSEVKDRFKRLFREQGLSASEIWGDGDGLGGGYILALEADGWPINEFRNKNYDTINKYFNPSAELWFKTSDLIRSGKIILPHDDILKKQMCSRKRVIREDGRLQLEPKKLLQGKSPDRADAVVGCIALNPFRASSYIKEEIDLPWHDHERNEEDSLMPVGCDAGM